MQTPLEIHASKPLLKFLLIGSALLLLVSMWLVYQLTLGKPIGQSLLSVGILALLTIAWGMRLKSERLVLEAGRLTQSSLFVSQSVDLQSLARAERYVMGKAASPRLKLEDSGGNTLIFRPGDFAKEDLEAVVNIISPYVFIARVEKNFMDLQFYADQGRDIPRSSVGHILRGTILFFILPCLILTLALVLWAIATKQPAFR